VKLKRLEAARQKAEEFVAVLGDLKSKEAAPLVLELVTAFADLAKDFGYEIPEPVVHSQFTCECGTQLQVHGQHHGGFRADGSDFVTCPRCGKEHRLPSKPLRLLCVKEPLGNRCRWTEGSQLVARACLYFNGPRFSLLPKNQDQYAADLRRTFGASRRQNLSRLLGPSCASRKSGKI
jgi:hypothetical protein